MKRSRGCRYIVVPVRGRYARDLATVGDAPDVGRRSELHKFGPGNPVDQGNVSDQVELTGCDAFSRKGESAAICIRQQPAALLIRLVPLSDQQTLHLSIAPLVIRGKTKFERKISKQLFAMMKVSGRAQHSEMKRPSFCRPPAQQTGP